MYTRSRMAVVMVVGALCASMASARQGAGTDQEVRIKRSQLPAAVEKTVAAESAGATVKGFSREVDNGQTFYEVELSVKGHARDVLMDEQGEIVEVEEQVTLDALPAGVRSALKARAGKRTIRSVESLTKRGTLVAYEAHVVAGGKWSEVQVGPNGETLDHEE